MSMLLLEAASAAVQSPLASLAQKAIDQKLTGPKRITGPRRTALAGLTSGEGQPVARLYGRVKVGGQVIWTTRFEESVSVARSGGKSTSKNTVKTTYSYYANLAVGLCEGPIAQVRRIWADGVELDQTLVTLRVHNGHEDQAPDALIVAKEGAGNAPAYRGLAYVVFERLPLADYGNRIPQLAFEVLRPVGGLGEQIRAVNIIPGAGEYAYATRGVVAQPSPGVSVSENRHQLVAASDWTASLDTLQALCPKLEGVQLVASWFGDDLRAGSCTIAPRVERNDKFVPQAPWSVGGLTRETARSVSQINGAPAYGGTPSDDSLRAALGDLKARGLAVTFYPFVMMDVPAGNALPDPWSAAASQPPYPWRGRITASAGADGTAQARAEVEAFFGQYRGLVLHYAQLCRDAGGIEAFLLGSELRGLTALRDDHDDYPAVRALAALAYDVRAILGSGVKIGYSADWTEYGGHVRNGGRDLDFPLDALWASPDIDFIGIDAYFPLSDWRDGTDHADALLAANVYDRSYLHTRVTSGEGFDWYYADDAARLAQQRSPISDGAYQKPWCFRVKDLAGWWSNPHVERRGGVEREKPTAWVPMSKPIRFVEIGCPAVDRGANGPNVFVDAKSSESSLPPFSRGFRDDLIQARALQVMMDVYGQGVSPANPLSPVYNGPMVDPRLAVWAWDARPFPAFPAQSGVWADAANWETGHWLNGRVEGLGLDALVDAMCFDAMPQMPVPETASLCGQVDGYGIDRVMSLQEAIAPLGEMFGFDGVLNTLLPRFAMEMVAKPIVIGLDDLVPDSAGELFTLTQTPASALPRDVALAFSDGDFDYLPATVSSRRVDGEAQGRHSVDLAAVLPRAEAQRLCDMALADAWIGRVSAHFTVRPSLLALDVGDLVQLEVTGAPSLLRITRITDQGGRQIEARAVEPGIRDAARPRLGRLPATSPSIAGAPHVEVLDLAIARDETQVLQHVAVFAAPWPGPMGIWQGNGGDFTYLRDVPRAATMGTLLNDLAAAPAGLIDRRNRLRVKLDGGVLSSVEEVQMLGGRNLAAVGSSDLGWEIIGFANAELVDADTYDLSELLRGLGGETFLAGRTLAAGARFVLLDEAVVPLAQGLSALGVAATYRVASLARGYGDAASLSFTATPGPKALMPFAPVHARAKRGADGVTFSFIRCGRRDADSWEAFDIPLGETSEAYRLDLFRNGSLVREIAASTTALLYPAAQELADFGTACSSFDIGLRQVSAAVGPGFGLRTQVQVF